MNPITYTNGYVTHQPKSRFKWLNPYLMAASAFIIVVLFNQLLEGILSLYLHYQTEISFTQVVSKPFDNHFWNGSRVLIIYAFPPVLTFFAALLIAYKLRNTHKVDNQFRLSFWLLVMSVLYVTTPVTLGPLAAALCKGPFYKSIAVVASWWGISTSVLLFFSFLSILINLAAGFYANHIFMRLAPNRKSLNVPSKKRYFINTSFVLPLIVISPLAFFLAWPTGMVYFGCMLLHSVLWLPGFYLSGYQFEVQRDKRHTSDVGFALPVLLTVTIILIRIFL